MNCNRSSMGDLARQGIAPPVHDSDEKCYRGRRTVLLTRTPDRTVRSSGCGVRGAEFGVLSSGAECGCGGEVSAMQIARLERLGPHPERFAEGPRAGRRGELA